MQMRQRHHNIGGITMNMQRAFVERGDLPVKMFFTLGYDVLPEESFEALIRKAAQDESIQ
jgi:hypothetical protein